MDDSRRHFLSVLGAGATGLLSAPRNVWASRRARAVIGSSSESPDEMARHERFMRMAIEEARKNRRYPFGAVIVNDQSGELLASGVNKAGEHPALHGEMVAMNDYVGRHGNEGWTSTMLYTTGEPCAMCMSAMVWAGLPRFVWGTSMNGIRAAGIPQSIFRRGTLSARLRRSTRLSSCSVVCWRKKPTSFLPCARYRRSGLSHANRW